MQSVTYYCNASPAASVTRPGRKYLLKYVQGYTHPAISSSHMFSTWCSEKIRINGMNESNVFYGSVPPIAADTLLWRRQGPRNTSTGHTWWLLFSGWLWGTYHYLLTFDNLPDCSEFIFKNIYIKSYTVLYRISIVPTLYQKPSAIRTAKMCWNYRFLMTGNLING